MTPETQTQSKLNLLRANLKQYQDSDFFTASEKEKLCTPIQEQIEKLSINTTDTLRV